MQKLCLVLFFNLLICCSASAQTWSDSLYFSKLYPLPNGKFLLIGSQTSGSFRKAVIRIYDQNLKIIQQRFEKNMRNSDIFLDEVYPDKLRVISRYRWNKGRVFIYDTNLALRSAKFFKRDEFKDWNIKTDESADYPVRGEEKLKGLNPIFYNDSLCFYFNATAKTIISSNVKAGMIKPVYLPQDYYHIKDKGDVVAYKFKRINAKKVLFYYSILNNGKRSNYFCFLKTGVGNAEIGGFSLDLLEEDELILSDLIYEPTKNLIALGGSFRYKKSVEAKQKSMDGYFLKLCVLKSDDNEMTEVYSMKEPHIIAVTNYISPIGYKVSKLSFTDDKLMAVFEKFNMTEKNVSSGEQGLKVEGKYLTYFSEKILIVNYELNTSTAHFYDFYLKYDLTGEKMYNDKNWRTFHDLKKQQIGDLIFNGETNYNYNDLNVVHTDLEKKKTVYADRNYNYFLCDWSGDSPVYSLLVKNEKYRCYFFDGYYVRYSLTDWGFELKKFSY